jgi:hypothetical protein
MFNPHPRVNMVSLHNKVNIGGNNHLREHIYHLTSMKNTRVAHSALLYQGPNFTTPKEISG